jgi:serine/threonine protein kinase
MNETVQGDAMTIGPGATLSHYRLIEKIGEGGMGVVWKAEDTTLKRPVALKFLTEKSYSLEDRRARFIREARLAAALNHPTICTVHEVTEVQPDEETTLPSGELLRAGTPFIAMEFLEGRTLADELRGGGGLPLDDLLRIAVTVAEGVCAAHARHIVHRDLKPGNVMLTTDGRAKILDFGLAKPLAPTDADDAAVSMVETISQELSREGLVVGTAAYMSPEQAQGKRLDSRSDVFSFGIMLYEMVAGTRPFRGETSSMTLLKIIEADPEALPDSRTDLPPELERIIRRCLKKKPDERYNDTRDLVVALKDLRQDTSSGRQRRIASGTGESRRQSSPILPGHPRGVPRYLLALTLGAVVIVLVALGIAVLGRWTSGHRPEPRRVTTQRQLTASPTENQVMSAAISPDGKYVAYADHTGLFLRGIAS